MRKIDETVWLVNLSIFISSKPRDVRCHRYAPIIQQDIVEDYLRFILHDIQLCPVINFMSLLPIVECSYLTTRRETIIRHKSSIMWNIYPYPARVASSFSRYLFLFTRMPAYIYVVRNSRKTRIIIGRTTNTSARRNLL